jgi:hypothetical protein
MDKVEFHRIQGANGVEEAYLFHCPGCKESHAFRTSPWTNWKNEPGFVWTFNGDLRQPTFQPSLRTGDKGDKQCHLICTGGVLHFCGDSWHELAGQSVPMSEIT